MCSYLYLILKYRKKSSPQRSREISLDAPFLRGPFQSLLLNCLRETASAETGRGRGGRAERRSWFVQVEHFKAPSFVLLPREESKVKDRSKEDFCQRHGTNGRTSERRKEAGKECPREIRRVDLSSTLSSVVSRQRPSSSVSQGYVVTFRKD